MIPKCKQIEKKFDYSTEERVIGKWINGENLYRKVVFVENITIENNVEKAIKHNIDNIKTVVNFQTCVTTGWGGGWGGDAFLGATNFESRIDPTNLIIKNGTGNSWKLNNICFIIEYTKTSV